MEKERLASPRPVRDWTRADVYFGTLARRRTARKARSPEGHRTQPESPRFVLSTLPFLALICAMAVLAVGIAIAAMPVAERKSEPQIAQRELGTAPKGWFEEAKREFR
jgi:hypothetical protein